MSNTHAQHTSTTPKCFWFPLAIDVCFTRVVSAYRASIAQIDYSVGVVEYVGFTLDVSSNVVNFVNNKRANFISILVSFMERKVSTYFVNISKCPNGPVRSQNGPHLCWMTHCTISALVTLSTSVPSWVQTTDCTKCTKCFRMYFMQTHTHPSHANCKSQVVWQRCRYTNMNKTCDFIWKQHDNPTASRNLQIDKIERCTLAVLTHAICPYTLLTWVFAWMQIVLCRLHAKHMHCTLHTLTHHPKLSTGSWMACRLTALLLLLLYYDDRNGNRVSVHQLSHVRFHEHKLQQLPIASLRQIVCVWFDFGCWPAFRFDTNRQSSMEWSFNTDTNASMKNGPINWNRRWTRNEKPFDRH